MDEYSKDIPDFSRTASESGSPSDENSRNAGTDTRQLRFSSAFEDGSNVPPQEETICALPAPAVEEDQLSSETKDTDGQVELAAERDSGRREEVSARPSKRVRSFARKSEPSSLHLAASTLLSLFLVLGLLLVARLLVPSLVESARYGWYRGQLRAEYEMSGQRLQQVSLNSLAEVSQLVSQRVGPSVAHINLLRDNETLEQFEKLFGGEHPSARLEGQGSGFVISEKGYVLTNHHVVDGVGKIEVTLSDGRRLPASIVGIDPPTDLAVLKVDADGLLPIEWGESEQVGVGTPVWALGSPFGLQQTVTFGIISGKHRVDFRGTRYEQTVYGGTAYGDLMQSDVALNPGNSGGPLVNSLGQVVGVNAAILGETYRGISFSIPSRVARQVAVDLIEKGEVPRGWLGISMQELPSEQRFDAQGNRLPGVIIKGFPAEGPSPAREGGLLPGDIIVAFNGMEVMSQLELMRLIGETPVGSQARVRVRRQKETKTFTIKIGKREIL